MSLGETKFCTKCKMDKDIKLFNKNGFSNRVQKFQSSCVECRAIYSKIYNEANAKIIRSKHQVYYLKNKELIKNRSNKRYKESKPQILESNKLWVSRNNKKMNGYRATYRANRRASVLIYEQLVRLFFPKMPVAWRSILHGVSNGTVEKPILCEFCSVKKKLYGHHYDYSKPLDIVWLCGKCHCLVHKKYQGEVAI